MQVKTNYSYSIIKYVHDTATSEFVNIGVAVFCPTRGFFKVICRSTVGRVSDIFPNIDSSSFKSLLRETSKRFNDLSLAFENSLKFNEEPISLESLISTVLPRDDSALIWTQSLTGITNDPQKTLTDLYSRYVTKYDKTTTKHKRTDEDVWRNFHRALEDRNISSFFEEKIIEGDVDEVKFKTAWKNGVWHCIESLSFDMTGEEGIKDKALRFLGQISSVQDSSDPF